MAYMCNWVPSRTMKVQNRNSITLSKDKLLEQNSKKWGVKTIPYGQKLKTI